MSSIEEGYAAPYDYAEQARRTSQDWKSKTDEQLLYAMHWFERHDEDIPQSLFNEWRKRKMPVIIHNSAENPFMNKPEAAKMPTKREIKTFNLGRAAYRRGATLDSNPYPKYDSQKRPHPLFCMWLCGWTSEQVDDE
jgi:hypothetical protein